MEYVRFGRTGMKVSRLCLGCMTYGDPARGRHPWTLDEAGSRPFIRKALDLGINFFDTANAYSEGTSEEIVGRALKDFVRRDEVVLATKCFFPVRKGQNAGGLSRKAIFADIDDSLGRLGTEHVDLFQIHRWDYDTPIEETMEALHDVVKAGKARYIGASSMFAWQFMKAQHVAQSNGWTKFVSMQDYYNLIYREEEREMHPMCMAEGIAVIPWSPMARGRLTRDWNEQTERQRTDDMMGRLYPQTDEADRKVAEQVAAIASARGVSRAQIALAWVLSKPAVTAPIVGASKPHHLDDAVAALSIQLTLEEIAALEAPYIPHRIVGFS